ncbi:hypothetical protein evm_007414 [Chilo suppressalis]|nr:hypothetical protein evm_007414 [Chilo suppressalis]
MPLEWTNENVITFLQLLETEPCLWDQRIKNFKNRTAQNNAWQRIIKLLPFKVSTEELKKKKESLIGYYRTHLHKFKKSLKSGASDDDVYTTNWFAYETMDSFLREVYESNRTSSTEINDYSEAQERSEGKNDGNENSPHSSSEIEEAPQNVKRQNTTRPRANKDRVGKRQQRDDLPLEIRSARRQMDEAFEYMKGKKDNEYEMFGRLIASKLQKISNPNTCDMLMNDIHNLVSRTCMADRLEQQSGVPQFSTSQPYHQLLIPSVNPSTDESPPGRFTSLSTLHQVKSPSPNPSIPLSSPSRSTSPSPHQALNPLLIPSSCQAFSNPTASIPISTPREYPTLKIIKPRSLVHARKRCNSK